MNVVQCDFTVEMNAFIKMEFPTQEDNENTIDKESVTLLEDKPLSALVVKTFLCHICSKNFRYKHHLQIHLSVHNNEKKFECEICERKFRQKSHLTQHNKIHVGIKEFACNYCAKLFLHRGDLRRHLKTHRSQLPFQCKFCFGRFSDYTEKQLHEQICKSRLFKCSICAFEVFDSNDLAVHNRIHIGERRFACNKCPKAFRMKHHLTVHLDTHNEHKARKFQCNICKKRFSLKSNLDLHIKYHNGVRAFTCDHCGKMFVQKGDLNRHIKIHTKNVQVAEREIEGDSKNEIDNENKTDEMANLPNFHEVMVKEEPIIETSPDDSDCDEHSKSNDFMYKLNEQHLADINFPGKCNAKSEKSEPNEADQKSVENFEHIMLWMMPKEEPSSPISQHQTETEALRKHFYCDICSKGFGMKHHLIVHLRTHTGQRDFQCEVCSKHFAQSSHLNVHLKIHRGDKAFACAHCEKRFLHRGDLHRHLKTHRELPFSCAGCCRRFSDESTKELHEESCKCQLYRCLQCNYETAIGSRLKTHMRVHTGERNYPCILCGKKFAYKQNLNNHLKTHSDERSFKCQLCLKLFRLRMHLTRHLKLHEI